MRKNFSIVFLLGFVLSLLLTDSCPAKDNKPGKTMVDEVPQAPLLSHVGNWTMVVMPDTQNYVKNREYVGIFDLMTAWIAKNRDALDIRMVLHVGDMINQNNVLTLDGLINVNMVSKEQWIAASRAMKNLDGIVPYIIAPGNHDFGFKSSENRESLLNDYFPVDRNPVAKAHFVEAGPNFFGKKTSENTVYEFELPGKRKMLVVALEFAPSDRAIAWAKSVFARPAYKNHLGVVVTHAYLQTSGKRSLTAKYQLSDANYGQALWEKLIYPSDNIQLVVCGHTGLRDIEATTVCNYDLNHSGKKVWQLLFDTQSIGNGNGGDGWLLLLEFSADGKCALPRVFSPLFDISPTTRPFARVKEPVNGYRIEFDR